MKITRKIWIAGALFAAMVLGGFVAATDESALSALGNGCCRVTVSPTAAPTPLPVSQPNIPAVTVPTAPAISEPVSIEPANPAP